MLAFSLPVAPTTGLDGKQQRHPTPPPAHHREREPPATTRAAFVHPSLLASDSFSDRRAWAPTIRIRPRANTSCTWHSRRSLRRSGGQEPRRNTVPARSHGPDRNPSSAENLWNPQPHLHPCNRPPGTAGLSSLPPRFSFPRTRCPQVQAVASECHLPTIYATPALSRSRATRAERGEPYRALSVLRACHSSSVMPCS